MNDSKKLKLVCSAMLQSWRIQGLGPRDRYTELHPTKSGIVGMIACALGYGRGDPRIQQLFNKTELYLAKSNQLICDKYPRLQTPMLASGIKPLRQQPNGESVF